MRRCYATAFGQVELSDNVLNTLYRYRQSKATSHEAGGQLFAHFNADRMVIMLATEPTSRSRHGRAFFLPFRREEQSEIETVFAEGLHYVGDWHSHPESFPEPSSADIDKIQEIYNNSTHQLNCMVMLILGTSEAPAGIWFGSVSKNGVEQAELIG